MRLVVTLGAWLYLTGALLAFVGMSATEDARHVHQRTRDRVAASLVWPLSVALELGVREGNAEADRLLAPQTKIPGSVCLSAFWDGN